MTALPTHNVLIQIHRWSNCQYLVMDYSEAGNNVLADLVTKWGGQWWDHGVNVMDCLHQVTMVNSMEDFSFIIINFESNI